ncbi:hypothetical protein [Clostridium sartagoforme]|uniref:hypothetical protein n=1 Tax=Clostridium sartagoforme TaxID=84031 RepID=UPI0031DEA920
MKVKAKVSFAGTFSMISGEIKECGDKAILQDLLKAGYIEKVTIDKKKEGVANED